MAKDLIRLLGPASGTNKFSGPLAAVGKGWDMVLQEWGVPLLDSEVNLMQQINRERIEDFIMAMSIPGWLKASQYGATSSSDLAFAISPPSITLPEDSWFVANGKMIHVTGTTDFNPAGGLRIDLNPMPSSGTRNDFVFLEFWRHEVAPLGADTRVNPSSNTPESGSQAVGRTNVYKEGGVNNNYASLNDLIAPAGTVGSGGSTGTFGETTRRVQLRWRFRVISAVDFATYYFGLGTSTGAANPTIFAQGGMMSDANGISPYNFQEVPPTEGLGTLYLNNSEVFGKGRLWRAGANTLTAANALNTVDGYVYAVPVFRLNLSSTGLDSVKDMRQLSHVYIPNHVLHADQLSTWDDAAQAGVYGAGFESTPDPNLSRTVKSNIRRGSISGGPDGDIAQNTITNYNIQNNTINSTILSDNSLTINKMNIDATGFGTIFGTNRTGGTVANGQIVVLGRNPLAFNEFEIATEANTGPTASIGVVANFDSTGIEATILNNQQGYIRLYGQVARLIVDTSVPRGTLLMISSVAGQVTIANQNNDAFAQALSDSVSNAGHQEVRALLFQRLPELAVRTSKIADSAITAAKIAAGQITHAHVNSLNIDGANIVPSMRRIGDGAGQVVAGSDSRLSDYRYPRADSPATGDLVGSTWANLTIAANAINTPKIVNGAVTNAKVNVEGLFGGPGGAIAPQTITSYNIADHTITTAKYVPLSVDTAAIGNLQVTEGKIASNSINAGHMKSNSVTTPAIVDQAVTQDKIAPNAVVDGKIDGNAVSTVNLKDGAVTGPKIGGGAVGSAALAAGAVIAGKIAAGGVVGGNLGAGAIDNANQFNVGVVNSTAIAGNSINAAHIIAKQVRDEHLGIRCYVEIDRPSSPIQIPSTDVGVINNSLNTSYSIVPWTNIVFDTPNTYYLTSPSWTAGNPNIVTVRKSGLYFVQFVAHIAGGVNNWYFEMSLATPGQPQPYVIDGRFANNATINTTNHQMSIMPWNIIYFNAGTQLEFRVFALIVPNTNYLTINSVGMKLLRVGEIA